MNSGLLAVVVTIGVASVFLALGLWHARRRAMSVEDYVVSRGTAGATLATATLVAGALGAWILFSPADAAARFGLSALVGYAVGAALPPIGFMLIGPRLRKLMPRGHSITEYALHRFGPLMYHCTLVVVVFYMLVFLSAELSGIALAVELVGGAPLWLTALVVGVLTVTYTAYGGMRASLFTDRIQFFMVVPLLAIVIGAGILGIGGGSLQQTRQSTPELFSMSHGPGLRFALALVVAIFSAEVFNQGIWQRVYAVRDSGTLRRAFPVAGLMVLPVVFLMGLFGIMAAGAGPVEDPSVAMFQFLVGGMPQWVIIAVLVLAVVLVMSSMDTLLNGIASVLTTELVRLGRPGSSLLKASRLITAGLIVLPILVASQGIGVLYLFLVADLVCAAFAVPVILGLYARTFTQTAAVVSSVAGLIVGALYFPGPDFVGWSGLPGAGDLLHSPCRRCIPVRIRALEHRGGPDGRATVNG